MFFYVVQAILVYALVSIGLHWKYWSIVFKTLPRDVYALGVFTYVNVLLLYLKWTDQTTVGYFDKLVPKRKDKPCFYYEDEVWTYEQVQRETYKVANFFQRLGYKKGDTVALLMENRPDYVFIWLGLSRIGVITSLVNYNIRFKALEHCVNVANAKAMIFGKELIPAIQEVVDSGGFQDLEFFSVEDRRKDDTLLKKELTKRNVIDLSAKLKSSIDTIPPPQVTIHNDDVILLVYTSGTTGLPKASLVRHSRVFAMSTSAIGAGLREGHDILITPVPLYHVQGGILGVTAAIFHGVPQVILRKFSASRFWKQCIRYDATASQYLGEIIRYLYNQPESPEDKLHRVGTFFGNGVNPAIWSKFVERFNNVKIKEIYGATEGNCNFMNIVGHVGACGFLPIWAWKWWLPYFFAKVNETTGEIVRDGESGLAIPAEVGQPGELLGKITSNPMRQFDGYTDKEATKKKIARDIVRKGDQWFRTGDLIVMDECGYWYFNDRIGDTFRWKGENCSTAEVEEVVSRAAGMKGCVVYGVQIPGAEGRCGMTAVADPENNLDLESFTTEINRSLPTYGRPLFLRLIKREMNMTGTFKLQKVDLQKEGFGENEGKDPIYFLLDGKYVELDKDLHSRVVSGKVRF